MNENDDIAVAIDRITEADLAQGNAGQQQQTVVQKRLKAVKTVVQGCLATCAVASELYGWAAWRFGLSLYGLNIGTYYILGFALVMILLFGRVLGALIIIAAFIPAVIVVGTLMLDPAATWASTNGNTLLLLSGAGVVGGVLCRLVGMEIGDKIVRRLWNHFVRPKLPAWARNDVV